MDCIFCKIVSKEIPAKIEHEDVQTVVFHDIHPKAKTHLLVIPKKHISTMRDLEENDELLMGYLMKKAADIAKKLNIEHYKLQINVGEQAGQVVFHLHVHLMSAD